MSELPARLDRLKRQAGRLAARVRPRHVALVAAAAVIGIGFMTVRAVALPGPRPVLDGDRLHIQVVAPVEPEITPGSVMDVGDLVDGFEYTPPPRPEPEPALYAPWEEEEREIRDSRSEPKRYAEEAVVRPPPRPEPPRESWRDSRAGRWFGFDAPDRDYRAEREARRARREARMRYDRDEPPPGYDREPPRAEPGREERSVRWYRSDGEEVGDRRDPRRDRDDRPPPDRWY